MIAKHVAMRSLRKSSFIELVRYMCDPQEKHERVGLIQISNCHSLDVQDAALEIAATQARNVRCESDKTYHLILSFRSGEEPEESVLVQIEERICHALGYAEHQRVSAVHHDTDNIHIHLAINKLHPERLTLHSPFRDYKTLNSVCASLEQEFGLQRDNHESAQRIPRSRADDMEHAAGIESLIGWVRREFLQAALDSGSWRELHKILGDYGLSMHERGNGLVIKNSEGVVIKASSVSRDFSKGKLEKNLGRFEPGSAQAFGNGASRSYQAKPLPSRVDNSALFERYQIEQSCRATERTKALKEAMARRDQQIASAKRNGALKRGLLKLSGANRAGKKVSLYLISKSLLREIDSARARYWEQRQKINQQYRQRSWHDWLQLEAKRGNSEALQALRARTSSRGLQGDVLTGMHAASSGLGIDLPVQGVTKQGTQMYRVGEVTIRDDGRSIQVPKRATPDVLLASLKLAEQRFGQPISVSGSTEFKQQVLEITAQQRLPIRFSDYDLEKQRLALLAKTHRNPEGKKSHRARL